VASSRLALEDAERVTPVVAPEEPVARRGRRRTPGSSVATRRGLLSLLAGLALWEGAVRLLDVNPLLLSPPTLIAQRFWTLAASGELFGHLSVSAVQFVIGYVGCALIAIPLGLALGLSERFRHALDPWISALYATPSISLAPLFIIWLGFGISSKAFIVALVAFFPIVINSTAGVDNIPVEYKEVAGAFGANSWERFGKILFPASLPFIFAGLRLAVGRGLVGLVVGDLFGARAGLGYLILQASQTFNTADLFVGTIVLALSGVALTAALRALELALSPWRRVSV
jgi:NitT/TauT family transport system permease protein